MNDDLPGEVLRLYDATGASFATVHFVRTSDDRVKGDCIFRIEAYGEGSTRSEVRWIAKRRFEKVGEHRFRMDREGALTVTSGDFELVLHPDDEGELHTAPDKPEITGVWEE